MSSLLRVLFAESRNEDEKASPPPRRFVTYVPVNEITTAADVVKAALAAFSSSSNFRPNGADESSARLVLEVDRSRVQGPDFRGGVGEIRGDLSMVLEPDWKVLHYMMSSSSSSQCDGEALKRPTPAESVSGAPWSVVAYLVVKDTQGSGSKFSKPQVDLAPELPDGRIIQQLLAQKSQQQQQAAAATHKRSRIGDDDDNDDGGDAHHHQNQTASLTFLPDRLYSGVDSLKPCSFTE